MLWNRKIAALVIASLQGCWFNPAIAAEVCPTRNGHPLRFVDVFDGLPEEQANLIADAAGERSGYWQLNYIYDAGRFVTVRCKYVDGQTLDVKLSTKVYKCGYKVDSKKTLKLYCK
jgi:hypothetical protein